MKKSKYLLMLIGFGIITTNYSCKKSYLVTPQTGTISVDLLATKAGVDGLLVGAYSAIRGVQGDGAAFGGLDSWQAAPDNWIYGGVAGGDAHKGSDPGDQNDIFAIATFSNNPSSPYFNTKWLADYEGITRCNNTIKAANKTTGYSATDLANVLGQARFLRAHFYFDLKRMFNNVPWIDETTTDFIQPNTTVDIWSKIEADFQYAYANLPATQGDVGRVNKWAAGAYLAKTYMYEKKYTDAAPLFDAVISQGQTTNGLAYALVSKFHDNFNADTKNNSESVFAIQALANSDPGGITQANDYDRLNYPYGTSSPFDCCSFYQPTADLVNHFRTNPANGLPYLDDFDTHPIKNDQGLQSSDDFTPDAGTIDPRLDWTVGRRGLPYLDWGLHPGNDWIRNQPYAGPFSPIKHVYTQAEQNTNGDQHSWGPGTAVNYCIIRFADVLLMAAEAAAQTGNLDKAETYVNQVRSRAANPDGYVYQYKDNDNPTAGYSNSPAANYLIKPYPTGNFTGGGLAYTLKAVYYERQIELAMEGHRFFDLVRWGIADQALNTFFQYEGKVTTDIRTGHFTKGRNEYYPIPQQQIDLMVKGSGSVLKQNPGYN